MSGGVSASGVGDCGGVGDYDVGGGSRHLNDHGGDADAGAGAGVAGCTRAGRCIGGDT